MLNNVWTWINMYKYGLNMYICINVYVYMYYYYYYFTSLLSTLNLHGILRTLASLAKQWDEVQCPHAVVDSVAYL